MVKFVCPCLNVSVVLSSDEPLVNTIDVGPSAKSVEQPVSFSESYLNTVKLLDSSGANETTRIDDILAKYFNTSNHHYVLKSSLAPDSIQMKNNSLVFETANFNGESNLKLKYPQLVGRLVKTTNQATYTMYKCCACNVYTHCLYTPSNAARLQLAQPLATGIFSNENSNSSNLSCYDCSLSSSDLSTNRSSLIATSQTQSNDTGYGDSAHSDNNIQRVFVISNQMIHNENEIIALKESSNYSSIYEILLLNSSLNIDNIQENKDLRLLFSNESNSSFENLLERIDRIYEVKKNIYPNEHHFKEVLEKLVNIYLKHQKETELNFSHRNFRLESSTKLGADKDNVADNSSHEQTLEKSKVNSTNESAKLMKKLRKASFRVESSISDDPLADSVFELEGDNDDQTPFVNEAQNNDDFDNDKEMGIGEYSATRRPTVSILKKRNSNVTEEAVASSLASPSMAIANFARKQSISKQMSKSANKYSCSLPRNIPALENKLSLVSKAKPIESDANDENFFPSESFKQSLYGSHMVNAQLMGSLSDSNFNFDENSDQRSHEDKRQPNDQVVNENQNDDEQEDENDDVYDEDYNDLDDDDELFGNNDDKADDFSKENFTLMGQAISSLASSIVQKDGRELFGGRPSRRIPMNSISKSCFD